MDTKENVSFYIPAKFFFWKAKYSAGIRGNIRNCRKKAIVKNKKFGGKNYGRD